MKWLGFLLALGLLVTPAVAQVAINEVRIDQGGTDNDEYVELYRPGGGSLAGLTYIVLGDGSGITSSGVIEVIVPLSLQTIPGDGFFLIAESTFTLGGAIPDMITDLNFENSDNVTHMLVSGFSGSLNQDLDTNDDGVLDITPWTSVVDKIAIIEENNPPVALDGEWHYGPPTVGPDGTFVPGHVYRNPDGTGTWEIGQFEVAGGADTPGSSNTVFPPPSATGKVTAARINTTTTAITLCVSGQNTPVTAQITGLPSNGTVRDNGVPITGGMLPYDLTGTLTYAPNAAYSGLDSFTFRAKDGVGQLSDNATQEVAVQSGDVFISEVMHRPTGNQNVYEFVEIYNKGASMVNLTRLDVRRAEDGNEKDTTDNLLGFSIPAGAVRILAPEDPANPTGTTDFRCEWQLDESIIIRIPLAEWEALFQAAPIGSPCFSAEGSRVLLFGNGGSVLDLVDLSIQQGDCLSTDFGSYALNPGIPGNPDNILNDQVLRWGCAVGFNPADQRVGVESGDTSNITAVAGWKPAFVAPVPCVKGACCTRGGGCVDDLFEEQCLELTCQATDALNLWHENETCDMQSCATLQTPQKCCLPGPAGLCADLTDCECTRVEGNADSGTCASNPGCIPSDGVTFNELDYDQDSTDTREFIELFGTADFDLSGWTLEFHNGNASTNGPTLIASRTVFLGGNSVPNDGGGLGYLVIGNFGVDNVDIDICNPAGAECSNRIENGGIGANGSGDGLVLLNNGVVVEAFSYASDGSGFVARGGGADGMLLPDIGVLDPVFGSLQRLPDGQVWTVTAQATPGETNAQSGACCTGVDGFTCDVETEANCSGVYLGDAIACEPLNPCIPRGACCLPSGNCQDDTAESTCDTLGGTWNGEDTVCPDIQAFVACVDGPGGSFGPGCGPYDYSPADSDVDLYDYSQFQLEVCESAPNGACCRVDGVCVITNQFDCEAFAGDYRGDGVSCPPTPACVAVAGDILINELLADDDSTDTNEFIELFGAPNASLAGLSLIVVDGDTGGDPLSAQYRRVSVQLNLNLLSLNPNGYLVIGTGPSVPADVALESIAVIGTNNNGLPDELQNGTQTYAIVATADIELLSGKLTDASVAAINANAIDSVATVDGTAGDHTYFGAPVATSLTGQVMSYGHRIPNGVDTNTASDWEVLTATEFGEVGSPTSPTFGAANQAIVGSCCNGITCTQTTRAACAFTFQGYNLPCTPNPCAGACCTPALGCSVTTESGCISPNAYLGGGTECTPNPCVSCTTIVVAEQQPTNTSVCITNVIVNTTYDTINSTNSANFTVQDVTGTNGITIFGTTATISGLLTGIQTGDLVEIRGVLDKTFFQTWELVSGATQLSLTKLGTGSLVAIDRTIGSLPVPALGSDDVNNVWVRMMNVEFAAINQGGTFAATTNYTINDASTPSNTMTLRINNANNPPPIVGTTIPTGPVNIKGILAEFGGVYQLYVFEAEDIETP